MNYSIKRTADAEKISYLVKWSPYYEMDKYLIRNSIPSEGGLYQLFYKHNRLLHFMTTRMAFYGGLRNTLLEILDPQSSREDPLKRAVLNLPCFTRFALTPYSDDLENLCYYFNGLEVSEKRDILVAEHEIKKIQYKD
jgi:hypothetical protein